jgi:hypothetical protein
MPREILKVGQTDVHFLDAAPMIRRSGQRHRRPLLPMVFIHYQNIGLCIIILEFNVLGIHVILHIEAGRVLSRLRAAGLLLHGGLLRLMDFVS